MVQFPLSFPDIMIWLAFMAILLLTTSEVIFSFGAKRRIALNKRKLRNASFIVGVAFIITVILRVYEIVTSI